MRENADPMYIVARRKKDLGFCVSRNSGGRDDVLKFPCPIKLEVPRCSKPPFVLRFEVPLSAFA